MREEETPQEDTNVEVIEQPYFEDYDEEERRSELQSKRLRRRLLKFCEVYSSLAAASSAMSAGSLVGWTSAIVFKLLDEPKRIPFEISSSQTCLVVSLLPMGATIGALFSGSFTQALGRKLALQCTALPCIASWVMLLLGESIWWLYIARILGGMAMGTTYTVAIVYITEITRPSVRGFCCCLVQIGFTLGLLYSYLISFLSKRDFHPMTAACVPLPFIAAIVMQLAPETPQYLIHSHQLVKAVKNLQQVRGIEEDIEDELAEMMRAEEEEEDRQGMFSATSTRKAFYITMGLMAFQQLTGIFNVYMNLEDIASKSGTFASTSASAAVIASVMLLVACITAVIVDRLGRKILLYASIGTMGTMALTLFISMVVQMFVTCDILEWIFFLSLMGYACAYNLGLGPLPWIIVAEMMPQRFRASACGLASATGWLICTLASAFYCWISGHIANYALYTTFSFMGVAFIHFVLPETNGYTLEEIHVMLSR